MMLVLPEALAPKIKEIFNAFLFPSALVSISQRFSILAFEELGRATYNGNAIVIEQPEEDPDVEEPTGDEEIPDEGDIDEEPIPDEPIPDENPEPVPETGDASAAVAVALTAAALVAAAGLAVVLKKAR